MKRILFAIFIILFICILSAEKFVVRFENPDQSIIDKFIDNSYDIASYKAGLYLDLVVDEQVYNNILSQGYSVKITQTEAQMKANLNSGTELDGYQDYDEMLSNLQLHEALNPDICKLYDIGDSRGKEYFDAGNTNYENYYHDIWALKISDNVEIEEDEPSIYYLAVHHAREPISLEVVMYFLDHILSEYGTDPTITDNINNSQIWIVPLVNPDGHKIVIDEIDLWWRKNICDNNENGLLDVTGYNPEDGTDPNRNYGWLWGGASTNWTSETYQGVCAFSEPETQAIRDLVAEHHFIAGLSYHSYGELILYPYSYENGITAPDQDALSELAVDMAYSIPGLYGGYYTPQVGWELYPTTGATDDYVYGTYGIFGYTVELATQFIPNATQVQGICEDNLQAPLIMLDRINHSSLQGHVIDAVSGDPIQAEIYIEGIDNTGEYRNPYLSNSDFGSYYRLLCDGNYTVKIIAYGYEISIHENVNINSSNSTILDAALVAASPNVTVTGIVTDSDTGWPVEGAVVEIPGYNFPVVTTNYAGEFEINDLYEYPYDFLVFADNYASYTEKVSISATNNQVDFSIAMLDDGSFETGSFGSCWNFAGTQPWLIDGYTYNSGSYSARSGDIYDNQTSALYVSQYVTNDDEISFYFKVSSEEDYDYLRFYIDNDLQDMWSGEVGWQQAIYAVDAGNHEFKWEYYKDGGVSHGSDCAWIDDILFPSSAYLEPPSSLVYQIPYPQTGDLWSVYFNWQQPQNTSCLGYNIYKDGSLLNTNPLATEEFIDQLPYGEWHEYYVTAVYNEGESDASNVVEVDEWPLASDNNIVIFKTEFMGNYPNPFNPETTFKFSLANSAQTTLNIYNLKGQLVTQLINEKLPAGIYNVKWNGMDMNNKSVGSGIYFSGLDVHDDNSDYTSVKKVILLK